jgi:rubrerythrin
MMTSALDVIKKGMSTEIWGKRFYEQAVARTQAEKGKQVFQSLVAEESKHLDILRGEYAAVSGSEVWVTVAEAVQLADSVDPTHIFPGADQAEQLIPADATDEQALKLAMDFEERGFRMYEEAAADASSEAEKTLWEWLAAAENKHYVFLQETYDYLVNDGVWYFDERELPFFEG